MQGNVCIQHTRKCTHAGKCMQEVYPARGLDERLQGRGVGGAGQHQRPHARDRPGVLELQYKLI